MKMIKNNKNIFILSLLICPLVFSENVDFTYSKYTINDIKKFDIVEECSSNSDCPNFAIECAKNKCVYPEFACSGNQNCYTLNPNKNFNMFLNDDDNSVYTVLDENNNNKKIIAKSCNLSKDFDRNYDDIPDNCTTAKCSSNDECLSNNCISGICQVNNSSPTYHCKNNGIYYVCNELLDEHCTNDNNCASYKCHESAYICVKESSPIEGGNNDDDENSSSKGLIIACIAILVIIILMVLCCILCMKRSTKNKKINNN